VGKSEGERDCLEDIGVNAKIILNWTLKKEDRRAQIGLIWLR
jgi:hypothetical protein